MAKTKRNQRGLSDKVRHTKGNQDKKTNPFEIRVNKQKHSVLGRKVKHDKGNPGVSRSRAIKKRKETLLKEYLQRNKSSKFLDKRLGENDATMTPEEKMMKRFAFEKQRHHEKASHYSLNDEEEELTHYGQSLAEIEKFETPLDESDDEEAGRLDAEYVAEEHFGGFLTRKKETESKDDKPKSKKELLEEKIAQSKKERYERQSEKEATGELREKLDEEWKEISQLFTAPPKRNKRDDFGTKKSQVDDYDVTVRELAFEMKAKATDRLKTPEELAKEEKERLENLEADRQRRMKGISEEEEREMQRLKTQYRSADDLGDDFELPSGDKFEVSYKEGKLLLPDGVESLHDLAKGSKKSKGDSGSDDDDEEEGDENMEIESGDDKNEEEEESDNEDDDDDNDDEEEEEEAEDSGADLESEDGGSDEESGEDEEKMEQSPVKNQTSRRKRKEQDVDEEDTQKMVEEAKKEIPYTFEAPRTYDDLLSLIGGHSTNDQIIILDRLRKCYHPSLAEGNKEKLETLFSLLVEYYGDLANERPLKMDLIDKLVRHLYELCQQSPMKSAEVLQSVITDKYEEFDSVCEKKTKVKYPDLGILLSFKLVSLLFPTSDFRHCVVTPTMLFMSQILTHCQPTNHKDVAVGLFVCSLFLQYVNLSKKFVPEVVNYLRGVLYLGTLKDNSVCHFLPPFKSYGKQTQLLVVEQIDSARKIQVSPLSISEVFASTNLDELNTDEFYVNTTSACLHLLQHFAELYEELPSYNEIFHPIKSAISQLNTEEKVQNLQQHLASKDKKPRNFLQKEKKKPPSMKFFEPKIEEDYDMDSKKKNKDKRMNEMQKLTYKHRREMKGAVREIRKDSQFIARQKLQEQLERDAERKQKVNELHQMLAYQEGDCKRIGRKKVKF
ncbi:nucleolar protein 14-like isoform X2 [Glandiceps talaboti]